MGIEQWVMLGGGALLALVGFAGLLLPALPGAPIMFGGLLLIAWAENFVYVGPLTLTVLGVLAALTYLIDFAAGLLGFTSQNEANGAFRQYSKKQSGLVFIS